MLSEVFYSFLTTSIITCFLAIFKWCYKSKCKEIDMCCIKILRDTEAETKQDEILNLNRLNSNVSL